MLYDLDVTKIIQRLKKIKSAELLVSNPSIELWFLLHYKNQTAHIESSDCYREMNNRNRTYKKGVIDNRLKAKLTEKISDAVKRAKKLKSYQNPSSTIYKLIDRLEKLS